MLQLAPQEEVVVQVRKHWLLPAAQGLALLLAAVLPVVLVDMVRNGFSTIPFLATIDNLTALGFFLYSLWLLVLWMIFAIDWTDYYLDVWYLTTERLVDVEQKGFFHRNEAVVRLVDIQDVTIETAGILATLLHFGDVVVQSAGTKQEFVIRHAAYPEAIKRKILELQRTALEKPARVVVVH